MPRKEISENVYADLVVVERFGKSTLPFKRRMKPRKPSHMLFRGLFKHYKTDKELEQIAVEKAKKVK